MICTALVNIKDLLFELETFAGILSKQPSIGGGTGNKAGVDEVLGVEPLVARMEKAK